MRFSISLALALALAIVVFCQSAFGQIETQDLAVEVAPINIEFPPSPTGVVAFRSCDEACDAPFARVSLAAGTAYKLNGEAVSFADFRQAFTLGKGDANGYALVTYNVESKLVLAIAFSH